MDSKLESLICIGQDDGVCFLGDISKDIYCPNYNLQTGRCEPLHYRRVEVELTLDYENGISR